jgi:hypothetical protein
MGMLFYMGCITCCPSQHLLLHEEKTQGDFVCDKVPSPKDSSTINPTLLDKILKMM